MGKKYILTKDAVKEVATAVVSQNANIQFRKQKDSEFYIADVDGKVNIKCNENIFPMETSKNSNVVLHPPQSKDGQFVDLTLRFKLGGGCDEKFVQERIAPFLYKSIVKLLEEKYNGNSED